MTITVTHAPRLHLDLNADEWCLYDKPGREAMARALNSSLMAIVELCDTRPEAEKYLGPILKAAAHWGANGSEGWALVDHVLDRCYYPNHQPD